MRIVYLNPVGILGGAERCLLSVLKAASAGFPGAELHLLACADGPLLAEAEKLGVRARALPLSDALARLGESGLADQGLWRRSTGLASLALAAAPGLARYARQLRHALSAIGPTLIHSNGIKTHLLARLSAPAGTPVVWHVHDFLGQRPIMGRVLRWAARRASAAIAVSAAVQRDAQAVLPGLPVTLIANAVDVEHFQPAPADGELLDRLAGLPPAPADTPRVGLVATYARWKGHDVFLDAAARLQRLRPGQARFYLVGGPVYATHGSQFTEAELRTRADALGLCGKVGFIGFQYDVADVYRALDVVVHASTRPEPFGLTIAEAMACGRAVVVARAGGAAELFTDGHDAIGVPPGDAAALAAAVAALLDDARRRGQLGAAARRTAVERFASERLVRQVREFYGAVPGGWGRKASDAPTRTIS